MEERLNAISIGSSSAPARQKEPPRADTLATLLTQGLQSKDKQILNVSLHFVESPLISTLVKNWEAEFPSLRKQTVKPLQAHCSFPEESITIICVCCCFQSVLQHSNETLIRNTVRRLPLPVIVPLTQELTGRMYGQSRR